MLKWALILLTVTTGSCGDILCAKGMSQGGELRDFGPSGLARTIRYIVTRRMVILGGVCYAAGFFSLLALLSVAELSVAVPATALSFVVDTIGARFLLREHVPWKRWLGVLCVTAGVVLVVKSGPSLAAPNSVRPSQHFHRGAQPLSVPPPPAPSPRPSPAEPAA